MNITLMNSLKPPKSDWTRLKGKVIMWNTQWMRFSLAAGPMLLLCAGMMFSVLNTQQPDNRLGTIRQRCLVPRGLRTSDPEARFANVYWDEGTLVCDLKYTTIPELLTKRKIMVNGWNTPDLFEALAGRTRKQESVSEDHEKEPRTDRPLYQFLLL